MVTKSSNTGVYIVDLDKTRHNGILRFTHEMTVYFKPDLSRNKCYFLMAFALNSDGWFMYDIDELDVFNNDYPGVLEEARKELDEFIEKEKNDGQTSETTVQ